MRARLVRSLAGLAFLLASACDDGGGGSAGEGGTSAGGKGGSAPEAGSGDAAMGGAVGVPEAGAAGQGGGVDACVPNQPGPATLGDLVDAGTLPAPVMFGMDQRPAIATCRPLPRPTGQVGDPFPQTLTATGCFQSADLRRAVPEAIPFTVNSPLWSDGADKQRWMVIPDGKTITVPPGGDFEFPIGTMLLKSFELQGKMLETRFLVRHTDGDWAGYTYVWDEAGDNRAVLLGEESATRLIGSGEWIFPSRAACLSCHTEAAGRSLGPEVGQLNGDFVYPGNRRANQLRTLDHLGLFQSSPGDPAKLVAYATPGLSATGSLEERARAYLHSNCSHCHRPGGLLAEGNLPTIDLRIGTALADTMALHRKPLRGEFGVPEVKIIKPGSAAQSMISVRMRTTVANVRMPTIGSTVVDDLGVTVIDAWINAMNSCR